MCVCVCVCTQAREEEEARIKRELIESAKVNKDRVVNDTMEFVRNIQVSDTHTHTHTPSHLNTYVRHGTRTVATLQYIWASAPCA